MRVICVCIPGKVDLLIKCSPRMIKFWFSVEISTNRPSQVVRIAAHLTSPPAASARSWRSQRSLRRPGRRCSTPRCQEQGVPGGSIIAGKS